jgi:tRNA A-37 threonylcarbamoyl transferase component Bud32
MTEKLGRYEILEKIGQGGFAIVYRAKDTELDRLVALKELRQAFLDDTEWVSRFKREARTIARLDHPHIVTIHDVGEAEGHLYLVMRLVEGPDLADLLASRGHLSWSEAVEVVGAVAEGLDYAHTQGILHRDLKPANILIDAKRGPLLSDFGLAKLVGDHSLSQRGAVVGTPHYIAPEVWEGQVATPQLDIYALGCILYEVLTGEKLFPGQTAPEVMMAHFKPLALPETWPEGVPLDVAKVLRVALAKEPGDRYATAGEMGQALIRLAEQVGSRGASLRLPEQRGRGAGVPGNVTSVRGEIPAAPVSEVLSGKRRVALRQDWGEAPDVSVFYGRHDEAAQLIEWLVDERCRLVGVLGMGGIGKTALVTRLAEQVEDQFDYLIWRSLRNAPPLAEILADWILFCSDQEIYELPDEVDKGISLMLDYLRQKRCLLILDNAEAILRAGERAGHYRAGYEAYGQLLQRVGESRHQSCLVLTSREKPREFGPLEGQTAPVRSLQLAHIDLEAGRAILQDRGLVGPEESWAAVLERYSGNPLALKLVAETVRELFFGDVTEFLQEEAATYGAAIFGGVRKLLAQQYGRLSELEQELLIWLAIEREAVGTDQLQENIIGSISRRELLETLRNLHRRSLLETAENGFTLQNVVMEFLTDYLVENVCEEIEIFTSRGASLHLQEQGSVTAPTGDKVSPRPLGSPVSLLNHFALLKAQAKDYIRESQSRLILQPIARQLVTRLGQTGLEDRLRRLLATLQTEVPLRPGYAGGNILNLLLHLKSNLRGYDFSLLAVWQAYLGGRHLPEVNFARADLAGTVFTDTFGAIISVAYSPNGKLLAAGTTDGQIRVWQARDGQPLLTCEGHIGYVWSIAFSPDGQILASAGTDQKVRLWTVANAPALDTGQSLKTLQGHTSGVLSVAFSPNGQTLASGSDDQTVCLWDVNTGQSLITGPQTWGLVSRLQSRWPDPGQWQL